MNNQIDERTHSAFRNSTSFSYFQGKSIRINKPIFCLLLSSSWPIHRINYPPKYQEQHSCSNTTCLWEDTVNSPTYYSFSLIHYSLHNNPEWNMSRCWREEKWYRHAVTGRGRAAFMSSRVSNKDYPKFSQSRRRPLLGPSPGWKRLLALSHLRHY